MSSNVFPIQVHPPTSKTRALRSTLLLCGWLIATSFLSLLMVNYSSKPCPTDTTPARWPTESSIAKVQGNWTLLVFAHPKCPCTRASLFNLARAIAKPEVSVDTHLLFIRPPGAEPDWCKSDICTRAAEIRGLQTHTDDQGREAIRFGAATSGHAVLYDPDGNLVFSGGLTASRGHEGDNAGATTIASALGGRVASTATAPVYGCNLHNVPAPKSSPNAGESR